LAKFKAALPEAVAEMVDKVLNDTSDMIVGDRLSSTYFEENKTFPVLSKGFEIETKMN
jgi:hypothetical protein